MGICIVPRISFSLAMSHDFLVTVSKSNLAKIKTLSGPSEKIAIRPFSVDKNLLPLSMPHHYSTFWEYEEEWTKHTSEDRYQ